MYCQSITNSNNLKIIVMDTVEKEVLLEEIKKSDNYKKVISIINSHRLISDREQAIGINNIEEKAMGAGGVGQIKLFKGFVYVQIGCGHTNWNYASAVKIGHIHQSGTSKPFFIEADLNLNLL